MSRSTLATLIDQLRGLTDAGHADYNLGTAVYWDADQLQAVLDRHRLDVRREPLHAVVDYLSGGTVRYLEYRSAHAHFETTDGGTAVFVVEDSTGADVGTASYTPDYLRGVITFGADQAGTAYYLTGRAYDLNAAAADVWRMKAANVAKYYDFSTDNHSMSRSQMHKHYLEMADYYAGQSAPQVITMYRSDAA